MIPTNTSSPSAGLLLLTFFGLVLAALTGMYIHDHFDRRGRDCPGIWVWPVVLGVVITLTGLYGMFQQGNYQYDVGNYVLTARKYKREQRLTKTERRERRHDKQIAKHDERRYHNLPSTNFHNPQVGTMTLKQFSKYQAERRSYRQQVKADWNRYDSVPDVSPIKFFTRRHVLETRHQMLHEGRKFFVRHSPLPTHVLKHDEHLSDRRVRNAEANQNT